MSKNRKSYIIALMAAVLAAGCCAISRADEVAESSRKIYEANKDAIVTVEMVIEMSMDSDKRETKSNSTGVIIDPSGLVITSLAESNPGDMSERLMGGDSSMQMTSKVIDAKIRLSDNTEVPVDIVLRDRDLDMVFLRPKKAADQPFKYIDLSQSAAPLLMDQTLTFSRLGQIANRSISISLNRVSAIVTKPRLCYVVSNINSLGCPSFTTDGKIVGITLLRTSAGRDDSSGSSIYDKMLPVILPCATIQNAAAQAKTASPEKAVEAPAKTAVKPAIKPVVKPPVKKPSKTPAKKPAAK
ncbi:MAG: serine protease [Armatimonadetes bacterium]|nr:serine protease [Armatimonadota bacterium]